MTDLADAVDRLMRSPEWWWPPTERREDLARAWATWAVQEEETA